MLITIYKILLGASNVNSILKNFFAYSALFCLYKRMKMQTDGKPGDLSEAGRRLKAKKQPPHGGPAEKWWLVPAETAKSKVWRIAPPYILRHIPPQVMRRLIGDLPFLPSLPCAAPPYPIR